MPTTPTLTRSDVTLAASLRIAVARLSRRLQNQRGDHTLTANQTAVLGTLKRGGPLSPHRLAELEKVQPPSMTRTLASLESLGLISRSMHPQDGRQSIVTITDRARTLMEEDGRRRDAWLVKQFAQLTREERELIRLAVPLLEKLGQA